MTEWKPFKKKTFVKYFDENESLYLKTDALGGLRAGLLQVRDKMNCPKDTTPDNTVLRPIAFTDKNLSSAQMHYSNNEGKNQASYIVYRNSTTIPLFREVHIITDIKPLILLFRKDVATQSQRL